MAVPAGPKLADHVGDGVEKRGLSGLGQALEEEADERVEQGVEGGLGAGGAEGVFEEATELGGKDAEGRREGGKEMGSMTVMKATGKGKNGAHANNTKLRLQG